MKVSQISLLLITLAVLRYTGQIFCMFLKLDLSDVFLLGGRFWGKATEVKCYRSHHISSICTVIWLVTVDVDLDSLIVPHFSSKKLLFPPLSILYSLESSHKVQPALKKWGACSTYLRAQYL